MLESTLELAAYTVSWVIWSNTRSERWASDEVTTRVSDDMVRTSWSLPRQAWRKVGQAEQQPVSHPSLEWALSCASSRKCFIKRMPTKQWTTCLQDVWTLTWTATWCILALMKEGAVHVCVEPDLLVAGSPFVNTTVLPGPQPFAACRFASAQDRHQRQGYGEKSTERDWVYGKFVETWNMVPGIEKAGALVEYDRTMIES